MRTILTLCALILAAGAYFGWRATRLPTQYGTFIGAPKAEAAELIERPKDFLGKTVLVEGTVREQCTTMGCYFFMPSGTRMLRIELRDIAMTAPMREGHRARAEGQLVPFGDGYQLAASAVEFQ